MERENIKGKSNLKTITCIVILAIIFILFFTGYSLGKSFNKLSVNGNAKVAEPIVEVQSNPEINMTDENQEGRYTFFVRNYNSDGKISDTKIMYIVTIKDAIKENLRDTIKFELYKNENKIDLNNMSTSKMQLENNKMQEDKYELRILYDKDASNFMQDILEKIQVQVHSEQQMWLGEKIYEE